MKWPNLNKMVDGIEVKSTGKITDNEEEYELKCLTIAMGFGPSVQVPRSMLVKIRNKISEALGDNVIVEVPAQPFVDQVQPQAEPKEQQQ